MAKILDGKILAKDIKDSLKEEVSFLSSSIGKIPKMVNILIGNDKGTCAYANSQKRAAEYIGLNYELLELPEDISQEELLTKVRYINDDETINGIMIHRPVPSQIDYKGAANKVSTKKDLEGINVENIGKMLIGDTKIIPCTPAAVIAILKSSGINIRGKEAVIVGHSITVGKPLSILLLEEFATITVCHIATSEAGHLIDHIKRADILVVAVGKPCIVKGDWIKKDAVVIDVGINNVDGKIKGDVEFDSAKDRAAFITPVPGGVGPVTVVMLMKNCIEAFKQQNNIK